MFNIREMKPEDKAVIMPMVSTFYHSPAVEHDVDTAVLERTFDAATDPTMPYISGLVMLEDEKVVGYGYVTGYYASEVGGMCMFMEEMYFTPECRGKGYGTKAYHWIVDHYPEYKRFRIEVTESNVNAKRRPPSSQTLARFCRFCEHSNSFEAMSEPVRASFAQKLLICGAAKPKKCFS